MSGAMINAGQRPPQPVVVPGFESINRYWDPSRMAWAAKIKPGEFYVSRGGELIGTVLGSCISVCIRDRVLGVGGMNHFMLPEEGPHSGQNWGDAVQGAMARYGNWAIEFLVNELMKIGAARDRFEVKVFGGGQVVPNMSDVGQRNILFTLNYLQEEGLSLLKSDVGDAFPRKVLYDPETGKAWVKKLKKQHNNTIVAREQEYLRNLDRQSSQSSDIELF